MCVCVCVWLKELISGIEWCSKNCWDLNLQSKQSKDPRIKSIAPSSSLYFGYKMNTFWSKTNIITMSGMHQIDATRRGIHHFGVVGQSPLWFADTTIFQTYTYLNHWALEIWLCLRTIDAVACVQTWKENVKGGHDCTHEFNLFSFWISSFKSPLHLLPKLHKKKPQREPTLLMRKQSSNGK